LAAYLAMCVHERNPFFIEDVFKPVMDYGNGTHIGVSACSKRKPLSRLFYYMQKCCVAYLLE